MPRQGEQGGVVRAFAEEEEAVDPEVVLDQFVYSGGGEFLSYVVAQEGGVAPGAITPAVGDFNGQGNAIGYFFDDCVCQ